MYDTMPRVITLPVIQTISPSQPLPGRYMARIQDVDCELEFRLDHTGCLCGVFSAEDEHLEIIGGQPDSRGVVFGTILTPEGDILAVFRAVPDVTGLTLELDVPDAQTLLRFSNPERVVFRRQGLPRAPRGLERSTVHGPDLMRDGLEPNFALRF